MLIAATSISGHWPPPDCSGLQAADAAEFFCASEATRTAADHNRGVVTPEGHEREEECKDAARGRLLAERQTFIAKHRLLIKRLRPRFDLRNASNQDWANLMYAKPAICPRATASPSNATGH
jgi:hypothetical protein